MCREVLNWGDATVRMQGFMPKNVHMVRFRPGSVKLVQQVCMYVCVCVCLCV